MKYLHIGLVILFLTLTSCSIHYYKKEGDTVVLYLKEPDAQSVNLHSSLNGFEAQILTNNKGTWTISLPANRSFRYFYKVDGEIFIPPCSRKEKDDFGSNNCIFEPSL